MQALEAAFWVAVVLGATASIATYLSSVKHPGQRSKGPGDVA